MQEYEKVLNEYIKEAKAGKEFNNLEVQHMNQLWERKLQNSRFDMGDYIPVNGGQKIEEKQARIIAGYALTIIYKYLEEINAASYPQTPQQVGGWAYSYFDLHYSNLAMMADGKTLQEIKDIRMAENERLGIKNTH